MNTVKNKLKDLFCNGEFTKNPDYAKVLAYRNSTVDLFNKMVRELVFDRTVLPKILVGDCLIADKPIMQYNLEIGKWVVGITTNEELRVLEILSDNNQYDLPYRSYENVTYSCTTENQLLEIYERLSEFDKQRAKDWDKQKPITFVLTQWTEKVAALVTYKIKVEYTDGIVS